ncbi:MAG: type-F conjugative transfer system pilin assembly protein TrbC [Syntrophales bacterium]
MLFESGCGKHSPSVPADRSGPVSRRTVLDALPWRSKILCCMHRKVFKFILPLMAIASLSPEEGRAVGRSVHVSTPTPCHTVERVEGSRVYLKAPEGSCIRSPGKVQVEMGESASVVSIFVDGVMWKRERVGEITSPEIREFIRRGESAADKIDLEANPHSGEGRESAEKADLFYRSDEFQNRLEMEAETITGEFFGEAADEKRTDAAEYYSDAAGRSGKLPPDERIYILVSSSVPLQTLRSYAHDVDRLRDGNIVIILRGFIRGMKKIKPTLDFIQAVRAGSEACRHGDANCGIYNAAVLIDPLIFHRYGVEEAPAFVYARKVKVRDPAMSLGAVGNAGAGDYFLLRGDVSLEYALAAINREAGSPFLDAVLDSLRGSFYQK